MILAILNKEVFIKEIGKTAKITIYGDAQDAIDQNWESLYFSNNDITFASVEIGNHIITLETNGEIRILNNDGIGDEVYTNENEKEIREILKNGQLDGYISVDEEMKKYILDNNNWFSVTIGEIIKVEGDNIQSESIDDLVFEPCPSSIEELEIALIEFATNLYQNYAV